MIERIQELSPGQIDYLHKLGQDALTAISPPISAMVYGKDPDQLAALQNIGPDALGAMSPQLADMLYGNDLTDTGQGVGQVIDPDTAEKRLGRYPGQPPIILPPFPQPPGDDGGDDDGGQGNEPFPPYPDEDIPPDDIDDEDEYKPDPGDIVSWWAFADASQVCLDNDDAPPRPYGEPFPSGDIEPPAHDHCRCGLVSSLRGSCPIHGYGRRIFELSSRY